MSAKPYDQAFKFLAEQDPESLLVLLGAIEPGASVQVELLAREISVAALLPDQPYLVTTAEGRRVVHVEAQTAWEPGIPARMAEYGPLHYFKYRLPVESYVLRLTRRGLPRIPPLRGVIEAGGTRLVTRYELIRVWLVSAEETLQSGRLALLPFVPLMAGGRGEMEEGARRLGDVEDERRRREMALHFVMLGGLRYNRLDLLELVGRKSMIPLEQLRESSFYQFILDEGRAEGREKGREEARKEALAAMADLFRLLAGKRFPGLQLGPEVEAVGDPEALRRLSHELDALPDAEALRRRLAELAAGRE
jgi:predicted transposase YdaD